MKWYEKFKVGQRVKVIKKVLSWKYGEYRTAWNGKYMDGTIGKIYKIIEIKKGTGFRLYTQLSTDWPEGGVYDYLYPVESLEAVNVKGKQLEFAFMQTSS